MAVDVKHGVGRAAEVLDVYQEMGCDIIGLQETRRSGQSALIQAGYVVYCSGESGGDGEGKKGQGGVGLAVRESISRAEARPPEFIIAASPPYCCGCKSKTRQTSTPLSL